MFTVIIIIISRYICVSNVRLGGVYVNLKHKETALIIVIVKFFIEAETRLTYKRQSFEKIYSNEKMSLKASQ